MTKRKNSSASRKLSKNASKGTKFGRDLIVGAKQILAHVERRKVMKEYALPTQIDVKGIRAKVGMSQAQFAQAFCLNRRTLQQWEHGKASPDLAVCAYFNSDRTKSRRGQGCTRPMIDGRGGKTNNKVNPPWIRNNCRCSMEKHYIESAVAQCVPITNLRLWLPHFDNSHAAFPCNSRSTFSMQATKNNKFVSEDLKPERRGAPRTIQRQS